MDFAFHPLSPAQGLVSSPFYLCWFSLSYKPNQLSSRSCSLFPFYPLPYFYLPFKIKLALISHHLLPPSAPKLMAGQRKRSQQCWDATLKLDHPLLDGNKDSIAGLSKYERLLGCHSISPRVSPVATWNGLHVKGTQWPLDSFGIYEIWRK